MQKASRGFTLVEVLITVAILSTLTILVAQSLQQAIKSKEKVQTQIDDVSRMRDAMRLIERDINLAYHYQDIELEIEKLLKGNSQQQQNPSSTGGFGVSNPSSQPSEASGQKRDAKRHDPTTHFVGSEEEVHFVTRNAGRTIRNRQVSDYVEVGYSLRDCRSVNESKGSSRCLWRRSSPFIDETVDKGGDEVVLLENVTEFSLQYIGKGKTEWVKQWRTNETGDASTKNNFPLAVEVSLTVEKTEKGKKKKFSMNSVIPIHFPNNIDPKANNPSRQQQNPGGNQSGTPTN